MERVSKSLAETEQIATDFLVDLTKQPLDHKATIVGLVGDLGAGKTTFAQAAGRALGIKDKMASPTFVIMKSYQISYQGLTFLNTFLKDKESPWKRLVHIDCYRLDGPSDLEKLGWAELIADPANLIFIEWPERVAKILRSNTTRINFEITGEAERKIICDL